MLMMLSSAAICCQTDAQTQSGSARRKSGGATAWHWQWQYRQGVVQAFHSNGGTCYRMCLESMGVFIAMQKPLGKLQPSFISHILQECIWAARRKQQEDFLETLPFYKATSLRNIACERAFACIFLHGMDGESSFLLTSDEAAGWCLVGTTLRHCSEAILSW